ncbi:MAG TPA: serine/threonine-protein kinase [Gemmatimonadales bacterium]|nr:serine/threonine-protein kinase [Gemmatimonadales bacterium]
MLDSHLPLQSVQRALAGRYRLERRLGRGGMGIVLLAHELRLDRRVALKLLLPAKATDLLARERFLGEARTAARLSHPNVVPIFAVDELDDVVFFAMAYVEGQTLGQRIRERGPLTPKEAARLLREVAWALAYAHERGVVHRDVKPDNILLDAATGRAVVSDFGIARVGVGSGTTGPREVVGTADFMSPEQASGRPVDARSDLYALGVVGYYALSGRLPFEAPDGYAMLARHIADPAPPLAAVAPDVPRRLAAVIDRCLMKDPSDRFVSGMELAEAAARAVAQPAVPPVAVRAFLVASRQLSGAALAYGALAGLAVPLLALQSFLSADPGARWLQGGLLAGILLLPLAVMRSRVRRLLAAGFDRDDLTEALETELTRRREELAFLYGHGPSRLERVLQGIAAAALASAAAVAGAHAIAPQLAPAAAWLTAFAASEGVALLAAVAARARTEHRTDPRWERRLRFWRSPLGGWLFRIAGLRLRRKDAPLQSAAPQPRGGAVGVVGDRFFEAREGRTVEDGRRR